MLQLKTYEIPLHRSQRTFTIPHNFLEGEEITVLNGTLSLEIDRSDHMIYVKSTIQSSLELYCDRSLDTFTHKVESNLEIIFKEGLEEEEVDLHTSIKRLEQHQQLIEFDQEVRDMLLLSLPTKRIHPRYLDEEGNPKELLHEQFGSFTDIEDTVDPRWEALKNLKN